MESAILRDVDVVAEDAGDGEDVVGGVEGVVGWDGERVGCVCGAFEGERDGVCAAGGGEGGGQGEGGGYGEDGGELHFEVVLVGCIIGVKIWVVVFVGEFVRIARVL